MRATEYSAGVGRDSPFKYTMQCRCGAAPERWGWPRFTVQVHLAQTRGKRHRLLGLAEIHRSSTLAGGIQDRAPVLLGLAEIHRSSTLDKPALQPHADRWGWPRFTVQVHSRDRMDQLVKLLGLAEIHRSSTLTMWQVRPLQTLGLAEIHRSSTLQPFASGPAGSAGVGRDSPFKYTMPRVSR